VQEPKLIGASAAHRGLLETLSRVASSDVEVLISGPTGVGKELYARYVHTQSPRRAAEFVPVNCGSLSGELLENELFGHIGGAFTGAQAQRAGLAAAAEGGTLFLDEVEALSPMNQVKLLRFIQEKEYRRLGESRIRRANLRFVAATNVDLQAGVEEGWFRKDLFFRLRVAPIAVPPLCDRPDDIPPILEAYVARYAREYAAAPILLSESAKTALLEYCWPGNIRELENCVRYLTCLRLERPVDVTDLPLLTAPEVPRGDGSTALRPFHAEKRDIVERFERDYLEQALQRTNGNISRAAQSSGKARRAFFELLRKHDIDAARFRNGKLHG
jgi:two-component system, NtrC family, response regulator GlrR